MKSIHLEISEQNFTLLWRALHAQEERLLKVIEAHCEDEESELAAFAGNDLIYLRLYREEIRKAALNANFGTNVFSLSDEVIEG